MLLALTYYTKQTYKKQTAKQPQITHEEFYSICFILLQNFSVKFDSLAFYFALVICDFDVVIFPFGV